MPCQELFNKSLTLEAKEKMVKECAQKLEVKYLQYCEDAGPLYWVAATIARLIIAKMSLIIYHPLTQPGKPNSLSQEIKDRLLMASIEILEYSSILESEASTKQWGWLFHTYIQWHAIAFILGELCTRGNSEVVNRAWRALDTVFSDWGRAITHTKSGMLWQPMRKLMAKARRKREENMQAAQTNELGIASALMAAPAEAYGRPTPCPGKAIAQSRLKATFTNNTRSEYDGLPTPQSMLAYPDTPMPPQVIGMGGFAPDQIQLQMQQQMQQMQGGEQPQPWLMEDSALLDLDMNDVNGDVNWEGWDDLVRDFQLEHFNQPPGADRGPTLGGMTQWW